jgi:FHA domain/Double zinc ribbon
LSPPPAPTPAHGAGVGTAGARPASSTPAPAGGLPGAITCPACGGDNQPAMNFCRLCGTALIQQPQSAAPPTPTPVPGRAGGGPELHTCGRCGGHTQVGFAFCQHCGAMLPTGPAMRGGASPGRDPIAEGVAPTLAAGGEEVRAPAVASRGGERPWASLYSVRRDGTDGDRYPLTGEWIEIGRADAGGADLLFDDRYLASRHARIEQQSGGSCRVVPIDLLNGVYRRIRAPLSIADGTQILLGRELLRFELVDDPERGDVAPLSRFGVTMFGSPPRAPWGRLLQVLASGGLRDVRHLQGAEVVIGREDGDIVFRDDEFLSRRHAVMRWQGNHCVLEDLKSSNGTFVRLSGPQTLESGDSLRMGDQMFRIELGGA